MSEVDVGMAKLVVEEAPTVLSCKGIGSCVVVTMYDPLKKIGGMLHSMLPESKGKEDNPARYVDTGIDALLEEMQKAGASKINLKVKVIGGADMFPTMNKPDQMQIGLRNIITAGKALEKHSIKEFSSDTGGTSGRSVRFSLGSGIVEVSKKI